MRVLVLIFEKCVCVLIFEKIIEFTFVTHERGKKKRDEDEA